MQPSTNRTLCEWIDFSTITLGLSFIQLRKFCLLTNSLKCLIPANDFLMKLTLHFFHATILVVVFSYWVLSSSRDDLAEMLRVQLVLKMLRGFVAKQKSSFCFDLFLLWIKNKKLRFVGVSKSLCKMFINDERQKSSFWPRWRFEEDCISATVSRTAAILSAV